MTTKHELKLHISELREIIKLKDKQISDLRDIIKQSYTGSHDLEKLPYPYDRSMAKIIRLGDMTVNSWENGDIPKKNQLNESAENIIDKYLEDES